tara:strand:+ start:6625 stop:7548 length:924 start_codon:yes stop_codon:yes gene_type:complete
MSPVGYLVFGLLGVVFFLVTHSEAILLDAVYSLISIAVALLALKVSRLVELPDSERFHFGYGHFEPLLNTSRIALILGVEGFALVSAIEALLSGGRHLVVGPAVWYGILSAVACLTMSAIQRRSARKNDSALLRVDARNWFIDGLISSGIGLAFIFGYFIEGTSIAGWAPYIDPAVVVVLILVSLPVALKSLRENLPQVLLASPDKGRQAEVRSRVEASIDGVEPRQISVRMIEMGRFFYVLIHIILPKGSSNIEVSTCDQIRLQISKSLKDLYDRPVVDVVFTADPAEALPSGIDEKRRGGMEEAE